MSHCFPTLMHVPFHAHLKIQDCIVHPALFVFHSSLLTLSSVLTFNYLWSCKCLAASERHLKDPLCSSLFYAAQDLLCQQTTTPTQVQPRKTLDRQHCTQVILAQMFNTGISILWTSVNSHMPCFYTLGVMSRFIPVTDVGRIIILILWIIEVQREQFGKECRGSPRMGQGLSESHPHSKHAATLSQFRYRHLKLLYFSRINFQNALMRKANHKFF